MKVSSFAVCAAVLALSLPMPPARSEQRIIEVHAKRFAFTPSEVTVRKGEVVTLELISDDTTHSLLIEGLGINAVVAKGHPSEVKIAPGKAGDFPGRCGRFCGSGHGQMLFVVHVTE